MSSKKITALYVVSTHWDREWYEAYQEFRYHLVELLDEVLDTMQADERFTCFQTDGQSVIIEDYLAIRPEREAQVRAFAKAGRLRIGPWYTMPDQNLVAPESLIRNLEEGLRVAREYGYASKAGFVCDIFGHVSQLPQIFRQFGIRGAFVFRGVNEDTERGMFRWKGADGTEVVTMRFGPKEGYFDLAAQVRLGFEVDQPFVLDEAVKRLSDYVDMQHERQGLDTVLLFDGGDHMPIEPQTVAMLEGLRRLRPDVEVRMTGLDEVAEAMTARAAEVTRIVEGELRRPGRVLKEGSWLIPGVLSSRIRLTQDNRAREADLGQWAEPFSHLSNLLTGCEYPYSYIRRAWRYLLENHAHDSICGCSPDQVHKDMEFRFDQCRMIAAKVTDKALGRLACRVQIPDLAGEEHAVVVFNPSQVPVDGPVDLELWFDEKTTNTYAEFFHFENKIGFRLVDDQDREIPYDYVAYNPRRRRFRRVPRKAPRGQECIVVSVTAPLKVPAFGYTTIICRPEARPTRYPAGGIVSGDRTLENEHLRVEVQPNGSLRLTDKRTKQVYERLLVVEDRADIGDGWYHGVAVNDRIYSSTACPADVAVIADGRQKGTLRITNRMEVPENFEFELKMHRSHRTKTMLVASDVTLRAGADHLEIRTTIDNQVRDHRVRVLFETNARTDTYLADSAFDVVERTIALPPDNHTYKELALETRPQASWTAAFDSSRGLAVVAPDLPESAVRDVPERTIALTLLRGFRRTVFRSDDEMGGQSLGLHVFNYRVVPLKGQPELARLSLLAQQMTGGVRSQFVLPREQAPSPERTLPRTFGQLSLKSGKALVTSLRRHPEKHFLELRLHNPYSTAVSEVCTFHFAPQRAERVDFEGAPQESLKVSGHDVSVSLKPKEVVTLAIHGDW
jgi:alpha-mannosidase/mannosylglycerate hydrolase